MSNKNNFDDFVDTCKNLLHYPHQGQRVPCKGELPLLMREMRKGGIEAAATKRLSDHAHICCLFLLLLSLFQTRALPLLPCATDHRMMTLYGARQ